MGRGAIVIKLQCCAMTEILLVRKTGNFCLVFLMLNRTAVESVQNLDLHLVRSSSCRTSLSS